MDILIIGGTRYFGISMTEDLILKGHNITIATRGQAADTYGESVSRIIFDRSDEKSIINSLGGKHYDVIIDKIAYSSNDVKRILDNVSCKKYILMSSSAVYKNIHANTKENEFDVANYSLNSGERKDFDYGEGKRQAECALTQCFPEQKYIAVRYPVVIGKNDYTKRLMFYVECIKNKQPVFINDLNSKISFIHENEAGLFLSHIVDCDISGAVNACSRGYISIAEIVKYIEIKTNCKVKLSEYGKPAPYNDYPEFATLNTDISEKTGFQFSNLNDWIFDTIDNFIKTIDTET